MKNKRFRNRRGATTVELALTLPVFFLLLFGFYELSRINLMIHTVETAAYEGARVGILPGATNAEVEDAVNQVLDTVAIQANIAVDPGDLSNLTDTIAVTIDFSVAENSALVPRFFTGAENLTRTCELFREIQD